MGDVGANGFHDAGGFQTDPGRQGNGVEAGAVIGVDEIDADRSVSHPDFPGGRIGQVDINPLKNRRISEFGNANGFCHGSILHGGDGAGVDLGMQDS